MKIKFIGITVILAILLIAFLLVAGCTQTATAPTGASQTPAATPATTAPTVTPATQGMSRPTVTFTLDPDSDYPDSLGYKVSTNFLGNGDGGVSVKLMGGLVRILYLNQAEYADSSVVIRTGDTIYAFDNTVSKEVKDKYNVDAGGYVGTIPYLWSQAFYVPQNSETTFKIDTTGDWKADVKVPLVIDYVPPISINLIGLGNGASQFSPLDPGDYEIDVSLENADSFAVTLMSIDGNIYPLETPKFTDAQLNGNKREFKIPFKVENYNNYLINVLCNGEWELTLSQAGNK